MEFFRDLKGKLRTLHESSKNEIDLNRNLCEAIKFHVNIKR